MMNDVHELIKNAIELGESPKLDIWASRDVDITQIAELTSCYVNDSWASKIKKLLANGWVLLRIQTEFDVNGHNVKAYFAKMKRAS